jgi:signal transduction histidine kinase
MKERTGRWVGPVRGHFRFNFVYPEWREATRAFAVFSLLLAGLLAIAVQLAFRELSLKVLTERLDIGRFEAQRIAREVEELGREAGEIDFSKVQQHRDSLRRFIGERLAETSVIDHVEVRDRFGVRRIYVSRDRTIHQLVPRERVAEPPASWPEAGEPVVRVRLEPAEGEVRVGLSPELMQEELRRLRNGLRVRVAVAGVLALAVLVVGFFYVLHLLSKNRRLEQSRQSAERAAYVGLLASGLAHEIRNPLNAMYMNLQMLAEELEDTPRRQEHAELLESTQNEIHRLEALVKNFLELARPVAPQFESRDLNAVVEEVRRFLDGDFHQKGVALRTDLEPLLPTTEVDVTQFKQALINLLVNARQVLARGGTVTIRTRAGSGGETVVEVQDDGPGVPADARERIFDVFYSRRGGGRGLGLPIARQIVERHGGTIELDSQEGQGATFRIRLPRHHPRPAPAGSPAEGRA